MIKKIVVLLIVIVSTHCYKKITTLQPLIEALTLYKHHTILVVLDIDNTLLTTPSYLGSDQWFYAYVHYYEQQGLSHEQAIDKALVYLFHIHNIIDLKSTYQTLPDDIACLKEHATVLCLTARSEPIIERTLVQLMNNTIILHKPILTYVLSGLQYPAFYKEGVIFCGKNNKAHVLEHILMALDTTPDIVMFVDDKVSYLSMVDEMLCEKNIKGLLFEFVGVDVASFDFAHTQGQLQRFLEQYPLSTAPQNYVRC